MEFQELIEKEEVSANTAPDTGSLKNILWK